MIALEVFKKILEENGDKFPLLTLDEFFDGNSEEDSIAPNQWEDGRPTLDEMWKKFREIEKLPGIIPVYRKFQRIINVWKLCGIRFGL